MNELALFCGVGGGVLGGTLCGFTTVCAVEINAFRRRILLARQNDGTLRPFPIWDDVRTFNGIPWRGVIGVVSGGFPCQDISCGGLGAGIGGARSGLWKEYRRIICEVEPEWVLVENSPVLTKRGLETVLGDLAALGYDAKWGVFGAEHAGAIHRRHRIFILAHSNEKRFQRSYEPMREGDEERARGILSALFSREQKRWPEANTLSQPFVVRANDGVSNVVDRVAAIGDAQVPAVVRLAWETLKP